MTNKTAENELIAYALDLWANHIETGDITLSANDCIKSKQLRKLKPLSINQVGLIAKLRAMSLNFSRK